MTAGTDQNPQAPFILIPVDDNEQSWTEHIALAPALICYDRDGNRLKVRTIQKHTVIHGQEPFFPALREDLGAGTIVICKHICRACKRTFVEDWGWHVFIDDRQEDPDVLVRHYLPQPRPSRTAQKK